MRGLRNIPTEHVQFLTVPRESYVYNANRDQLVEPEAEKLFALLRADRAVAVTRADPTEDPRDSATNARVTAPGSGATPAPTFRGNTAAEDTCG